MYRNESFVLEDTLVESSSIRGASLVLGERLHRDPQSPRTNHTSTSTLQQEEKHLAEDISFRREAKERYRNSDLELDNLTKCSIFREAGERSTNVFFTGGRAR